MSAPFRNETRARHGALYASAIGLERAAKVTGLPYGSIRRWRKKVAEVDGKPIIRAPNPGNTGKGKLSLPVARTIRAALAAGARPCDLARLHGVDGATIRGIRSGRLYPESGQP